MTYVLFAVGGRLSRWPFWLGLVVLAVIGLASAYSLSQLAYREPAAARTVAPFAFLPAIWVVVALSVKRLHDRGKSGVWLLAFGLLPCLITQIANRMANDPSQRMTAIALAAIGAGLVVWGVVELAFLPGSRGANRFGTAPSLRHPSALD